MNKSYYIITIFLIFTYIFISCKDVTPETPIVNDTVKVPEIDVTVSDNTPFTGGLYVYPCYSQSSVYCGNYNGTTMWNLYATYSVENGVATSANNYVWLPIGNYNLVYWGLIIPTATDYTEIASDESPIAIGDNLSQRYISLQLFSAAPDSLYHPTFNYSISTQSVNIGTDTLGATMERVCSALDIIVQNYDNSQMSDQIDSMEVTVGSIAQKVDYYSATPVNQTRTVYFPLVFNDDSTQMISKTVMLFPSAESPLLNLNITLNNGTVKNFSQNLTQQLTAGNKLTLTVILNTILSKETNTKLFYIEDWIEQADTLNVLPL